MLEVLCVVRLIERLNPLRTTANSHQYKAVWYAGRGVDDNSRLEALTIHPSVSRFLLSSNAPGALTHARSSPVMQPSPYCLTWVSLRADDGGEDFSSDTLLFILYARLRSVRSGLTTKDKKEEPHPGKTWLF